MRLLVAPNAFKGTLTARQAAGAMARGVRRVLPRARIRLMPIADGGDGLLDALRAARGGRFVSVRVTGPLGEPRRASLWICDRIAAVEMARASGLALLPASQRDPLGATTFGPGELITAAIRAGAREIWVGLGGSASSDGGAGMAQALGFDLTDASGRPIGQGARGLLGLEKIAAPEKVRRGLRGVTFTALSDVANPLLGPRGSARVYGPQKGATPVMVRAIEDGLARYARILRRDLGVDVARRPGAGAAGGMGAGLMAFLDARVRPGADFVLDALGADAALRECDAVLTGEGRMDRTSFEGKAPLVLAGRAARLGVPAAAVCGSVDVPEPHLRRAGVRAAVGCVEAGASPEGARARPAHWVERAAALAVRRLGLAAALLVPAAVPARPTVISSATLAQIDYLYFHRHQGRNLDANAELVEGLLAEQPADPGLLWRMGRALVRQGERQDKKKERVKYFERAEGLLRKAVGLAPKDTEAHFWLGLSLGKQGQSKGILKSLGMVKPLMREMETVIALDPGHGGAHHVLGEMYRQLPGFFGGDKRKAVAELETALKLTPNYTAHYPALAEAYLEIKRKDKAVETLKRIFDVKNPEDPGEYDDNLKDAREMLEKLQ